MRLRPTGNKGPVAVSLESFARYHASESWTWERMALTRARVIASPGRLARQVEAEIARHARGDGRSRAKIIADARDMRSKLAAQFPASNRWDLKFAAGGLVDIEFIAQTLQLCAAPGGRRCPGHQHDRGVAQAWRRGRAGRRTMRNVWSMRPRCSRR